jgi:hypothetical protein
MSKKETPAIPPKPRSMDWEYRGFLTSPKIKPDPKTTNTGDGKPVSPAKGK